MADWKEVENDIMAKIKEFESVKKQYEDLQKKVTGQEELTQKFKQEIGDARKMFEEFSSKVEGIDSEKVKKIVDKLEEIEKNIAKDSNSGSTKGSTGTGPSGDKSDLVLTEEQKKKADEVFLKLSPEERTIIKSDPVKRKSFLEAAVQATPQKVPDSLFDEEPVGKEQTKNEFLKLFGLADRSANNVTGTKNMGPDGFGNADPLTGRVVMNNDSKRLIGGKIPRPSTPQNK